MLWSCSNLTVIYRQEDGSETIALREISISIQAGTRIAIVGPNGSGKSTLALVIAGLMRPSSGSVTGDAKSVDGPTGAMVFQSPDDNLIGATVRDEIELCLEQSVDLRLLDEAIARLLARFGLESLAARPASQLSGGEKQIAALACAFASGRHLIVLDEPTSHLDPHGRRMLWEFLEPAGPGAADVPAIVVVTQYPNEVSHFDRVIALDDGSVVYDGPPTYWWIGHKTFEPSIAFPTPSGVLPILSARDLGQVDMPGWPLPEHPVRGVTLGVRRGEAIALCGPIGAGKTTLAFLLAGLLTEYRGERRMEAGSPVMLIQFPERQLFCKNVEDEVAFGLIAQGMNKVEAGSRAHEALQHVGLHPDDFSRRDPFSLSGGQKRRVMLAAAAALESPLYILDEPQAALDDDGLATLARLCQYWLTARASYFLISHDLEFLRSMTNRVLVINKGQLVYDGSWDELHALPNLLGDIAFS